MPVVRLARVARRALHNLRHLRRRYSTEREAMDAALDALLWAKDHLS
jgi:hypothetical protein